MVPDALAADGKLPCIDDSVELGDENENVPSRRILTNPSASVVVAVPLTPHAGTAQPYDSVVTEPPETVKLMDLF